MKSQAKTITLKKKTITELNAKQLKTVIGGTSTVNEDLDFDILSRTISTFLCFNF